MIKYKPTLDEYYKQYKSNSNFKFYKTINFKFMEKYVVY